MANRCGLIILWFGDEDNFNLALNTLSLSFWECLKLCFHCPIVAFAEVMNEFGYILYWGKYVAKNLFALSIKGFR